MRPALSIATGGALCAKTGLSEQMERGHSRIETAYRCRMAGSSDSCTSIAEVLNRKVVEDDVTTCV